MIELPDPNHRFGVIRRTKITFTITPISSIITIFYAHHRPPREENITLYIPCTVVRKKNSENLTSQMIGEGGCGARILIFLG